MLPTTQAVTAGELRESPSSTGAVAEAGGNAAAVAVAAAAAAMAADGAQRVPVQVGGCSGWVDSDSVLSVEFKGILPGQGSWEGTRWYTLSATTGNGLQRMSVAWDNPLHPWQALGSIVEVRSTIVFNPLHVCHAAGVAGRWWAAVAAGA
jgi:hypothetical protein